MMLRQLDIHMQKNEIGPLTPDSKLLDINLGDEFLDLTPKAKATHKNQKGPHHQEREKPKQEKMRNSFGS